MKKNNLSVVIIVKNEEGFIGDCLESVKWADEVILLDGGSTDQTLVIAQKYQVKIVKQESSRVDFAAWHNQGKDEATSEWLLYLDADERVTLELAQELQRVPQEKVVDVNAYQIRRRNFLLGRNLEHGGWGPDYQIRLFRRQALVEWQGSLHERPVFTGKLGRLAGTMIHLQPEKLEPALAKSITWSKIESKLLFKAHHPVVAWWRVLRMGLTTFWQRLVIKQGWRDGIEGWIENFYQVYHTMVVYLRLWELQKK